MTGERGVNQLPNPIGSLRAADSAVSVWKPSRPRRRTTCDHDNVINRMLHIRRANRRVPRSPLTVEGSSTSSQLAMLSKALRPAKAFLSCRETMETVDIMSLASVKAK